MEIRLIDSRVDRIVYNNKAAHPLQSWEWGEARKKMGIEVVRVGEYEKNVLKNIFQITFHKIPHTPLTIGYLPRSIMPNEKVLEYCAREGKKRKSIFIKIEPYAVKAHCGSGVMGENKEAYSSQIGSSETIHNERLAISPHPLFPNWTQIIDLTQSEEKLLKNMHPKTRYNIRLAQKKGVVVKEMTNEDGFNIFSKLYFDTCRRQGYRGHTEIYHKMVYEALKNTTAHILIAYYKNIPLSAFEIFIFNDVMYYPYGGSSIEFRNVMAPNMLMWEAIRFGKKRGVKSFDMWGSLPPDYDRSGSWAGFTRFKEGYGGRFVEFVGSFDLIINPFFYRIYNSAHSLRRIIMRMH